MKPYNTSVMPSPKFFYELKVILSQRELLDVSRSWPRGHHHLRRVFQDLPTVGLHLALLRWRQPKVALTTTLGAIPCQKMSKHRLADPSLHLSLWV